METRIRGAGCQCHEAGAGLLARIFHQASWDIDKSTPATPILDRYLNLDIRLKNPHGKNMVNIAEFVLRGIGDHGGGASGQLQTGLDSLLKPAPGIHTQAS
jgi:hypothetical protein